MTQHARLPLGRLPGDPSKPRLRLARYQTVRPQPPTSADWLSRVRAWGDLGNFDVGDCTAAGAGHIAMAVDKYGQGRDLVITTAQALAMYSAVSGYDPTDPATDVGATLQDALDYWRRTGIGGNRIAAFAELNAGDLDQVRACIAEFGAVYCGMDCPDTAETQFLAGQPWTVQTGARSLGGHCVPIGAYNSSGFTCVTWGRTQEMTVDFFRRFVDEIWVPIDLDWLAAPGRNPAGLDVAALNGDYQALTGDPGPFPVTPPTPPPPPGLTPSDADADLAAVFARWRPCRWRRMDAHLAAARDRWKAAKGL